MITILFIVLAGISKAIADTLSHHFDTSVFKNKNPFIWDPDRSTAKFFPFTKYRMDPWHFANSLMIFSFVAAIAFRDLYYHWAIIIAGLGVIFVIVFNLFYDKILRRV